MPIGDAPRPLPWRLVDEAGDEVILDATGGSVHIDTLFYPTGLARADAAYIVDAVNVARKYELALYRIAGLGDITRDDARKIAAEALGIELPS